MITLFHIITDLDVGGAEMMLYQLLSATDRSTFAPQVVSLTNKGTFGPKIEALGIPVHTLNIKPSLPNPLALGKLIKLLRREKPALIQTWLYHADLLGSVAAKFAGGIPTVWGIHNTVVDAQMTHQRTVWIIKLLARLSGWLPTKIISCAEYGATFHIQKGYQADKFVVIPNGFDTQALHPDPASRQKIRNELGLAENTFLIGLTARFSPEKDHQNFIQAAHHLQKHIPNVHFVLCGKDITWDNTTLATWIDDVKLRTQFHLLGQRNDTRDIHTALDIASLASYSEAFPMVLGEAMACGVPCVATDTGDNQILIGDTGYIVAPRHPQALADAWGKILHMPSEKRQALGAAARHRIEQVFSLALITQRYHDLYRSLIKAPRP